MEPIRVPAPSPSAFNKGRRVSDLLDAQLKHFQHLEKKLKLNIPVSAAEDIHTEAGAARYIAQITTAIRTRATAAPSGVPVATLDGPDDAAADNSSPSAGPARKKQGQRKSAKRKNP
jgi:hypothetical protein